MSPKNSPFKAIPGPEEAVTPNDPPKDAPKAAPIPAISSSAWNVLIPNFFQFDKVCKILLAGVIGYPANVRLILLFSTAANNPKHVAKVPFIFLYLPAGNLAFSTTYLVVKSSAVSP